MSMRAEAGRRAVAASAPRQPSARPDEAVNRARYERRQQEAAQHRQDLERRRAESDKPRRPGLPTPP